MDLSDFASGGDQLWGDFDVDPSRREFVLGIGSDEAADIDGSLHSFFLERDDTDPWSSPPWQAAGQGWGRGIAIDHEARRLYATEWRCNRIHCDFVVVRSRLDLTQREVLAGGIDPVASAGGLALDPAAGLVYWVQTLAETEIRRAQLDGSAAEPFFVGEPYAIGAIAIDPVGRRLYWVDESGPTTRIRSQSLDGGDPRDELEDLGAVGGIAIDPTGSALYWTVTGESGAIRRAALGSTDVEDVLPAVSIPGGSGGVGALRVLEEPPPADHAVVIADTGKNAVLRFDVATRAVETLASGGRLHLAGPRGVAVEPGGKLVVASRWAEEIVRIDPATGAQSAASAPGVLDDPIDVAVDGEGRLLVVELPAGSGRVVRLAADGASAEPAPEPPVGVEPLGLASEPGGTVLATAGVANFVYRIDVAGGTATPVADGPPMFRPTRIAVGAPGEAFVSDGGPATVFRIDLATGATTPLLPDDSFQDPFGVAVDPNGDVLVLDRIAGQLVRVDPRTGARRVLSESGAFADPRGVAILPVPVPEPGAAGAGVAAAVLALLPRRGRTRRRTRLRRFFCVGLVSAGVGPAPAGDPIAYGLGAPGAEPGLRGCPGHRHRDRQAAGKEGVMRLHSLVQAWRAHVPSAPRALVLVAAVLLVAAADAGWLPAWAGFSELAPACGAEEPAAEGGLLLAAPRRLVLITLGTAALASRRVVRAREAEARSQPA
jgi:DNA-binding beta-propeller fold protein YncE